MSDTPATPVATITNQVEGVGVGPTGAAVGGVRVYFKTAKGITAFVFVPRDDFTPASVNAAVRERALAIDAVQGADVY